LESEVLTENNYWQNVKTPWFYYLNRKYPGQIRGKILSRGDEFVNVTGKKRATDKLSSKTNDLNPPPYTYSLDPAAKVPALVTAGAGAGKGPFSE